MFVSNFGNLITAMVTPFKQDLTIDFIALERLINYLIDIQKSDSLLITGTTGENPTLDHEEEWELLKKTKAIVSGRAKILFGAGSNCTKTAVSVSQKAQELGADGILSISPYYNKPNQEGIFSHFSEIAKSISLPIMLYNNPGRTCSHIELNTIKLLREKHENIVALKESSGSLGLISSLSHEMPNFAVYAGDDNLILPSLAVGAVGAVSVSSHLVGEEIKAIIAHYQAGRILEARKLHGKLFAIFNAVFGSPSPGPVKYLLSEMGICSPHLRLPLTPPSKELEKVLLELMKDLRVKV